jgi:hypothetical protein
MLDKPSKARFRSVGSRLLALSGSQPQGQQLVQHLTDQAAQLGCPPEELGTQFPETILW